ncbi:zinc finger CCCH domain-containing protein 13-like [Spodoptera litura]|uniref:Zinc finger CCCH domain-containing protein 13-like n=1 Tax=Spodoptera litura TaxID=69820 RepID=A0A9J7E2N5_SPOLT|nr:zinc finger CCCH domain-containing protein 13-like [Spodoptera litura]
MDKRREDLTKLKSYTQKVDNDLTMILQSLQWDRKNLLQNPVLCTCRYDSNHNIPPDKIEKHEKICFLRENGYSKEDQMLPEPLDANANTLVKLKKDDIQEMITNASRADITFKKGVGCHGAEPMSLERLQVCYSADERRVIHDAVVSAVPSCHDLADLALLSESNEQGSKVILTRKEILLELRNMRRRRTKYRVAPKTRNYSDVLRDVIKTQMEVYNDVKTEETIPKETVDENNSQYSHNFDRNRHNSYNVGRNRQDSYNVDRNRQDSYNVDRNRQDSYNVERNRQDSYNVDRDRHDSHNVDKNRNDSHNDNINRYEQPKKWVPRPIQVKIEREEHTDRDRIDNRRRSRRDSDDNERHRHERKKWVPRPIQEEIKTENEDYNERDARTDRSHSRHHSKHDDRHRHERPKKWVPKPIKIEVKTEREHSSKRDSSSESRHSRRDYRNYSEDRDEHDEDSVPRPIKEEIKTEREDSTERQRCLERRYSSQDLGTVPRPIKVEVKTEKENTKSTTEHRRERSHKTNRDEVNRTHEPDRSSRRDHNPRETRYFEKNDQERTQKYGEHSRKRRDGYEEYSNNRDKRRERHNYTDDREYRSEKRHKTNYRSNDYDVESKRRKESRVDEESYDDRRQKRDDRRKDKDRRRKDKQRHRNYEDGGSRQDYRHEDSEEPRDMIQIKQERPDSVTSKDNHDGCYDEGHGDRNCAGHRRYYDDSDMQNVYDPNKKIKTEK